MSRPKYYSFCYGTTTSKGARGANQTDNKKSFREQVGALRNLPKFFRLIWETSKQMTIGNLLLRLIKSAISRADSCYR